MRTDDMLRARMRLGLFGGLAGVLLACAGDQADGRAKGEQRPDEIFSSSAVDTTPDRLAAAGLERVWGPRPEADTVGVYGWARLSDAGAPAWGLRASDTLPELRRTAVPEAVRRASLAIARREQLDPRCTRVFGRDPYFVDLLRYCPMRGSHEPGASVLLDRSGRLLSERALEELHIVGTCPGERDTTGRALRWVTRGDTHAC